jgi:predicted RNA binding protein with dsRBD fold (UPF0201 family)
VAERFDLDADVRSANPQEVLAALRDLFPDAAIETTETGLRVRAQIEGETARVLNRAVLTALRRAERRTTLRAEWTSGTTVERFFDYVPKGIRARG